MSVDGRDEGWGYEMTIQAWKSDGKRGGDEDDNDLLDFKE